MNFLSGSLENSINKSVCARHQLGPLRSENHTNLPLEACQSLVLSKLGRLLYRSPIVFVECYRQDCIASAAKAKQSFMQIQNGYEEIGILLIEKPKKSVI